MKIGRHNFFYTQQLKFKKENLGLESVNGSLVYLLQVLDDSRLKLHCHERQTQVWPPDTVYG